MKFRIRQIVLRGHTVFSVEYTRLGLFWSRARLWTNILSASEINRLDSNLKICKKSTVLEEYFAYFDSLESAQKFIELLHEKGQFNKEASNIWYYDNKTKEFIVGK